MKNRIYNAFNEIKAEDKLKQDTYAFLQNKIKEKKNNTFRRYAVAFVSAVIILFTAMLANNVYFTETAVIDIDVNPSIELILNRFDLVISAHAYNDDGEKILNIVNIENKPYRDALEILIGKMVEMDYIKDTGLFTATLQMNNNLSEKELLDSIKTYIDSALQLQHKNIEQDIFTVDFDTKTHSQEQNLTPAKYLAISELQSVDPSASFDSCRDHSIREIKRQAHGHGRISESSETDVNRLEESENTAHNQSSSGNRYGSDKSGNDQSCTSDNHEETHITESYQQSEHSQDSSPATNNSYQKNNNHRNQKKHGKGH